MHISAFVNMKHT